MTVWRRRSLPLMVALVVTGLLLSAVTAWAAGPSPLAVTSNGVSDGTLRLTVDGPAGITGWSASADGSPLVAETLSETANATSIVFVVETSSSMGYGRDQRALEVIRTIVNGSGSDEQFALIAFDGTARVVQGLTLDRALPLDGLFAAEPDFGSALFDGVRLGAEVAAAAEGSSTVVLITRGWDFGKKSVSSRNEALDALSASGASAYVVALGSDVDVRLIDGVAVLGDGLPRTDTAEDIDAIVAGISDARGSRYELAVSVDELEPGVHELLLAAKGTGALTIASLTFERPAPVVPLATPTAVDVPATAIPEVAALTAESAAPVQPSVPAGQPPWNQTVLGLAAVLLALCLIFALLGRRWRKARARGSRVDRWLFEAEQSPMAAPAPHIAAEYDPDGPLREDSPAVAGWRRFAPTAHGQLKRELRLYVGLVALALTLTYVLLALWTMIPLALGWQPTVVTSGSMAPTIAAGDVIVARPYSGEQLQPGAVIVFREPVRSGLLTHRIVTTTPDGEFVTRGDANLRPDSTPIHPDQVVGVASLVVPSVALPVIWLEEGEWIRLTIVLVVAVLLIWCSRWALFERYNPWSGTVEDERRDLGWRGQRAAIVIATTALFGAAAVAALAGSTVSRAAFLGTTASSGNAIEAATLFTDPQTYYVRTDGSDANTGTTNSAGGAWLTIQKAADSMFGGDTVLVQPGTYVEQVTPAAGGTAANPISYQASGAVVIDGGNTICYAFQLLSVDYIVIDGFEITNQPDCGGSDGVILLSGDSDFVTIRHNIIHDTGRDAIVIYDTSNNTVIENNLIYNIDDDAITPVGGGSHTIRNNSFYNTGVTTGAGGYVLEGGDFSNLFENNIFWASNIQNTALGSFNYNDYNGGVLAGTGNISSDPLFVNTAAADFQLGHIAAGQGADSPAIDVGSTTAAALGLDTRTTRTDSVTDSGTVDLGYHYTTIPPPTIASLSPTSGSTAGGTSVVITGTDFTGATAVDFGAVAATGYVVDSDTQITATSPAQALGTVDVRVTTPSGTSANSASDDYDYTSGGGSVTLLGSWGVGLTHMVQSGSERLLVFVAGYEHTASPTLSAVTYGGQALTKVNDVTTGTTTLAHVEIWILDESGVAAASGSTFVPTWTSAPSFPMYAHAFFGGVDQTTPTGAQEVAATASSTPNPLTTTALATNSGDMVVVGAFSGNDGSYTPQNGFTEGNDQTAGSTTTMGTSYKAASGTSETPSMLHSGPNRQVIAAVVLRATAPAITSLSPTSGSTAGGNSVVITGTDFTGATAVTFGGTAATGYVVDSDTQITATSPAHAAGTVDVQVTTPDGTSANTAADDYAYVPPVTLLGSWGVGLTHTVQSGSDRLLVFVAGYEDSASPTLSAVTYGGQALTKVNDVTTGTSPLAHVEIWILDESGIAAASGSTFVPTWTSAPANPMYAHAFFGGVDQTTPTGAQEVAATASSTPNPLTTTALATNSGDMVVVGAVSGNDGSYTPQNGFTEGNDQTAGSTTTMGTSYKAASGTSETPSMLHSGPNRQVIAAVVLRTP